MSQPLREKTQVVRAQPPAASKSRYVIGLRGAVWDFVLHGYTLD